MEKKKVTSFEELSTFVEKHIATDPVGTMDAVLEFYGPRKLVQFNTRRHKATIAMVVAVRGLARLVELLGTQIDTAQKKLYASPKRKRSTRK